VSLAARKRYRGIDVIRLETHTKTSFAPQAAAERFAESLLSNSASAVGLSTMSFFAGSTDTGNGDFALFRACCSECTSLAMIEGIEKRDTPRITAGMTMGATTRIKR
jgi:malate/lactate dehydrogenase